MERSIGSRLFARTLPVLAGGTHLKLRGIVLLTAHVSKTAVKSWRVRVKNRCLPCKFSARIQPMKDLDSYLNDHLAGSISALEALAYWAEAHKGEPLGSFFVEIEREIKADQDTLRDVMRALEVEESTVRKTGGWAAEKVARARLIIAGDEIGSLGLVLTLEGLIMGVTGKKGMWVALAVAKLPQLSGYNLEQLQRRAEQQLERIEAQRILAIRQAFAGAHRSK